MVTSKSTPFQIRTSPAILGEIGTANLASFQAGSLIINADDWGRDIKTTDIILECVIAEAVSSASAMVFMADSERAARLAREWGVDCGLHLNFTMPFSQPNCPARLREHQARVIQYLRSNRLAPAIYHPGLASSFKYVAASQIQEFERLFGIKPRRLDGHHHMHLSSNVLFGRLLPAGTIVRRSFSFRKGEKSRMNRSYRGVIDSLLAKRHQLTDFFFSLSPLEPESRINEIFSIAHRSIVEVETHPVNLHEYRFLTMGEALSRSRAVQIARGFTDPAQARAKISAGHCQEIE